jgi:hypothetical protein
MSKITTPIAIEKSTYVITAAFTDEDGDPVVPNSGLNWTLTDLTGTVVNSRSAVTIAVPAASVSIVLSGLDLALADGKDTYRILTVEGTYNSALGSGLPIKASVQFKIQNLIKVT